MIFARDAFALGVAAIAVAALGGIFILPAVYPTRLPIGYVAGAILSYGVQTTKYGGTRGWFDVQLDRGEVMRVPALGGLVPADRVCIRGVQRGEVIEGGLVAMDRCLAR
jgi:hypothetical protein